MDMVKKNIVSIICGLVAIAAVGALFWPTAGWTTELQAELDKSKSNYADKIDKLLNPKPPRTLPLAPDPNNPTADAPPLTLFPTKVIIDKGEKFKDKVSTQAKEMLAKVIEVNKHRPLLDINPKNPVQSYPFKRAYREWLGLDPAEDANAVTVKQILNAIEPPNDNEVKAEKDRIWNEQFKPKIYSIGGVEQNTAQITGEFEKFIVGIEEKMRRDRAEHYKVYLDPEALESSSAFAKEEAKPATYEAIWFAQNMQWIDQDIAEAIARINKDAKNIMDAPVKQLIKVSVPQDIGQYVTFRAPGSTAGPTADAPAPPPDEDAMKGKAYGQSETGRVSNPLYDVIQFHVEMNVDANRLPMILTELQRGHLITVFRADAQVVDARAAVTDGGYVYGSAPIVHLWLECEELFMRGWTVGDAAGPLMPPSVQAILGIGQPTAPGQ